MKVDVGVFHREFRRVPLPFVLIDASHQYGVPLFFADFVNSWGQTHMHAFFFFLASLMVTSAIS